MSRRSLGKGGMHYVYILRSETDGAHYYVGSTGDLHERIRAHNAGSSPHTAKYRPWTLVWYCAFETKAKADAFESYLKSGSGRAFQKRHLA